MFLSVGEGEYNDEVGEYQFPLVIRSPKLIKGSIDEEVIDVRFYSELDLGTVKVDGETAEVTRPHLNTIKSDIRDQQDEVEIAVRKALVSSAGHRLSHLPFPENQYAPLEDILSHVLVKGTISKEGLEMMDSNRKNDRYQEYAEKLVELDLLDEEPDCYSAGNVLIGFYDNAETYQEAVNDALGRYFEHNIGEFKMINRTLGPYLVLAGRYYRRSLELEEMPVIEEEDLRQAIVAEYTGLEQKQKLMKLYRYLVHLEDVGILECVHRGGDRYWTGTEDVDEALREQSEFLAPVQTLLA